MLPEEYFNAHISIKLPNSEIQQDTQTKAPIRTSYNLLTEVVMPLIYTSSELLVTSSITAPCIDEVHLVKYQQHFFVVVIFPRRFPYKHSPTLNYKTVGDQTGDMAISHSPRDIYSFGKHSD